MKYAFIREVLAAVCTIRMACRLLGVSPQTSASCPHLRRPATREGSRSRPRFCASTRTPRRIHSSPKVVLVLPRVGVSAHLNAVPRVMRERRIWAGYAQKWRRGITKVSQGGVRRRTSSAATSWQIVRTRSGFATSPEFRPTRASSTPRARCARGATASWEGACPIRCTYEWRSPRCGWTSRREGLRAKSCITRTEAHACGECRKRLGSRGYNGSEAIEAAARVGEESTVLSVHRVWIRTARKRRGARRSRCVVPRALHTAAIGLRTGTAAA